MKTLKNTTIIAGIIVALFSLTAHASGTPKAEVTKAEKNIILKKLGLDEAFEMSLIVNYLNAQVEPQDASIETLVKIYNEKDELIFEGKKQSEEAVLLIHSADFLMEYEHTSYYKLHN